jgi:ArsR family transcriptional regulator
MDDSALIRVLKALAHPTRFRMVQEIAAAGELSCGAVGGCVPIAQPTTSHHLRILADAGILIVRREGQLGLITVNRELVDEVASLLPTRLVAPPKPTPTARRSTPSTQRSTPTHRSTARPAARKARRPPR